MAEEIERGPRGFVVRLTAAQASEASRGVPLTNTRLPSLDTPRVLDWLANYKDSAIFVLPEGNAVDLRSEGADDRPSLLVEVEEAEYESVVELLGG
jgi:hypothetical protein